MTLHEIPEAPGSAPVLPPVGNRTSSSACGTPPAADPFSVAGAFSGRRGERKPIVFGGRQWPSQQALAKHLGLTRSAVSMAITRGRLHFLGTGRASGGATQIEAMREARKQPVAAAGWSWPSQREAARALGTTEQWVSKLLFEGKFERFVIKRLGVRHD